MHSRITGAFYEILIPYLLKHASVRTRDLKMICRYMCVSNSFINLPLLALFVSNSRRISTYLIPLSRLYQEVGPDVNA